MLDPHDFARKQMEVTAEFAEKQFREEGLPIVCVGTKGLAPPHGSRSIDPVIEPVATVG